MTNTLSLGEREPLVVRAAITTAVTAVVHVAVVLGLPLDAAAEVAIGGAVDAVGLVVILVLARPAVTANAKVIARVTTEGAVVAGEAAIATTGDVLPVDDLRDLHGDEEGIPALLPVGIKPELVTP